eukprot:12839613-Alexandrium_andersonii.AAC.1
MRPATFRSRLGLIMFKLFPLLPDGRKTGHADGRPVGPPLWRNTNLQILIRDLILNRRQSDPRASPVPPPPRGLA